MWPVSSAGVGGIAVWFVPSGWQAGPVRAMIAACCL